MNPADECPTGPRLTWAEPDPRPLGWLALGLALISTFLAPSYFFTPFAYLAAVPAFFLGLAARGVPRIRAMGTVSVGIAVVACGVATVVLVAAS